MPPSFPTGGAPSTKRSPLGCGIAVAVLAIVGLSVFGAVRSCSSAIKDATDSIPSGFGSGSSSEITFSGSAEVLSSSDGTTDTMVVVQDTVGGETVRRLARVRFSAGSSKKVWESERLDDSASRAEVALVGDTIFAGVDGDLYALDAATGDTRWHTKLHDDVTTGCPDCFAIAGQNLVVRTTDAYVTAYAPRSPEAAWSRRLNSRAGSIAVPDGQLLIVDDPEDTSAVTPVQLVDPATGKTIRSTAPTCPKKEDSYYNLEMSAGDPVSPLKGSNDVVAAFGFSDACVVRWDPASGTVKWTSRLDGASSLQRDATVQSQDDLVLTTSSSAIVHIDLRTGLAKELEVPNDYRATPDRIVGRTLVADLVTERGTPKGGLIAWDLASGKRLWAQSDLGKAQPTSKGNYFSSDALFDDSPRSVLVPDGKGLNVFVFDGSDGTFSVRPLDLSSGDLGPEVKRAFLRRYESGTPSLTIEAITPTHLLVSIDTALQTIPVSGKGTLIGYPS